MTESAAHSRVRGLLAFRIGGFILIATGLAHSLAVIQWHLGEPPDADYRAIVTDLKAYSRPMGPFEPSAWDTVSILNESYSVLLIGLGVMALVAARPMAMAGRLRAAAGVLAAMCVVLTALALAHGFPPPAVFASAAGAAFVVSLVRSGAPKQA